MSRVLSHHIGEVVLRSQRIEIDPEALIDSLDDVIANLREMREFLIRQSASATEVAPTEHVLHCWTDEREHAEQVHGRLSPQWTEAWFRDVSGTCMLPQGHDGPHQFTPDDKIGVTFTPANPHPSGCHTEAPGSRDCNSDGHESCGSCSRRTERDEQVWREGGIVVPPRDRAK